MAMIQDDPRQGDVANGAMLAVGMALVLGFVLTWCVSSEPVRAYRAFLSGPLPSLHWDGGLVVGRLTRLGAIVEDAITLGLLGLAMLFGFRARQFGMGADGQFFLAALGASWVSLQCADWPLLALPAAAVAAIAIGFVWGGLAGYLKARFDANEIVTTLMLNVIAIQLYRYLITSHFHDVNAGFLATPSLPATAMFGALFAHTHLTSYVVVLPLACLLAWFFLYRSVWGYEIRMLGDSRAFAECAGIPVRRAITLSLAMGGAFAGLAGLHVSNALLQRLPVELTPGIGFDGLVVALLARNDPRFVPLTALLYAYLKAGGLAMERGSDVPHEVVLVIQAVIVLFVVSQRLLPEALVRRFKRQEPAQ